MRYCSILVFIALLSPRHVVLADKTSRRNLRVQRHQAYAHEHAPTRTRRLGKQNEANASSVDNQQGGKRGRNKKGKAGKTAPLDQLDPNNQIIQLDEPITLPAPSTSKNPTLSPVTNDPTSKPSASPSGLPSKSPSISPSHKPTIAPSQLPTQFPSLSPSSAPTLFPTNKPTQIPSISPSSAPTLFPTNKPTQFPSSAPTLFPTNKPTLPHCDLDAKEYSTGQYTGGDKVLYTDEEGTMTYICMFQQCGGVEGKTPGRWGGWGMIGGFCDPSPTTEALEPLTKEITIDDSTTKPTLSPSTPPTNKPTLPKCLGSEYNKESSPPYGAGNFAYYSANGEDYEYFKCRADGLCNLNAGSPGRPGWFLLGDCNPPSTESDLLSSSGCPEPWRNLATYHQNDYSSVMETDGTFVIYKCYNPEHCKTVAPGGYLSKTAWFVDGFC